MMTAKWLVLCGAVCVGFVGSTSAAQAQTLRSAEFRSHTLGNDKDHDSAVYLEVRSADGKVLLAEVSGGDGNKRYADHTDNTLGLVVKSNGSTKTDSAKFKFKVGFKPNGKDKWEFRGSVVLTFTDGTTLVQDMGNTFLEGKNELKWTEWVGGN